MGAMPTTIQYAGNLQFIGEVLRLSITVHDGPLKHEGCGCSHSRYVDLLESARQNMCTESQIMSELLRCL